MPYFGDIAEEFHQMRWSLGRVVAEDDQRATPKGQRLDQLLNYARPCAGLFFIPPASFNRHPRAGDLAYAPGVNDPQAGP